MANAFIMMCFSQQQSPGLAPISSQLPAASIKAQNNRAPLQCMPLLFVKKNPPFMQPYTNPVLPEETLSSYTDKPYRSTIPILSSREELLHTEFGTKEMSSSMNTSGMPTHSAFNFISSASNTSTVDNGRNGWELMELLSNKTHKQTQTSEDSNVSGTSSWNGSACGGMSKETLFASGTSASGELQTFLLLPPGTQSKRKRVFCMLL
jgi:hypothetical protein